MFIFTIITLERKVARILDRKRREKSASSAVSREPLRPLSTHFNFLGLPLEIRDMIGHTLEVESSRCGLP
jgi:hypothetical protein